MEVTYNFKAEDYERNIHPELNGEFLDVRNGIRCIGPTVDLECYLNYLQFLNGHRDKWKNYGYLDLGMIPVAMGPSFIHKFIVDRLSQRLGELKIGIYRMPSVSLFYDSIKMSSVDLWMFREDASKAMGKRGVVTAEEFIRWCW